MRLDHNFTVPVPVDEAWQVLLDVPRIAPCMPGAALTEFDGDTFAGTVKVKLGPIGLTYRGTGRFVERDEAARRVVIEASGRDTRAAGTAAATVTATLVAEGDSTRVEVGTDLTVTGKPAQFGRGMLADVSGKLIGQFAACLAETLSAEPASVAEEPTAVVAPVAAEPDKPAEVEPIDLLKITGVAGAGRRYGPYVVAVAVVGVAAWLVVRWLRG
jgi:carbon monoxide dehydrogenase subunit G